LKAKVVKTSANQGKRLIDGDVGDKKPVRSKGQNSERLRSGKGRACSIVRGLPRIKRMDGPPEMTIHYKAAPEFQTSRKAPRG
jgi:hypothetical protein